MKRTQYLWVALALALLCTDAPAKVVRDKEDACHFWLTGEITEVDLPVFTSTSCGPSDGVIAWLIHSPGGDAQTAMAIGRWLRERNAKVFVPVYSFCQSSCALIYISGIWRINAGEIGLHRPYLGGTPLPSNEVRAAVESMLAQVGGYIAEMGITPDFTNIMLNTPPEGMQVYAGDAIKSLVPEHDLLYDELKTARQARLYGLTTEEYRRREVEADERCMNRLSSTDESFWEVIECKTATKWGLSVSVYKQRQATADERCDQLDKVTDEEWRAWGAAGHNEEDHPVFVDWQRCLIPIMQGR